MSEKVQVVIFQKIGKSFDVLLLQTNKERGNFWQNITGGVEKSDQGLAQAPKRSQ